MVDTILLDLDGTLLHYTQDEFISTYLPKLSNVFARLGLDPEPGIKALWASTEAMIRNDGTRLNSDRFWEEFSAIMGLPDESLARVENACEEFYATEFNSVRSILKNDDLGLPRRLIDGLTSKGYIVVLATNPLFPASAVTTRLGWVGLSPQDFCLITNYANSAYCKPNLDYYREILTKIGKMPGQCLMVGNNTHEDMTAGDLGIGTFLVTDYLENEADKEISDFPQGTLADLAGYLGSFPVVGGDNA